MIKKYYRVILCIFVIVSIASFLFFSDKESKQVIYNGNKLMVSVDGVKVSRFPTSGNYYLASYDCDNKNTVVSWDRDSYQLSITNKGHKGGVSCYVDFSTSPKLSYMKAGSYVKYIGDNGCNGRSCQGVNANYVDVNHKGYCSSLVQYYSDGW